MAIFIVSGCKYRISSKSQSIQSLDTCQREVNICQSTVQLKSHFLKNEIRFGSAVLLEHREHNHQNVYYFVTAEHVLTPKIDKLEIIIQGQPIDIDPKSVHRFSNYDLAYIIIKQNHTLPLKAIKWTPIPQQREILNHIRRGMFNLLKLAQKRPWLSYLSSVQAGFPMVTWPILELVGYPHSKNSNFDPINVVMTTNANQSQINFAHQMQKVPNDWNEVHKDRSKISVPARVRIDHTDHRFLPPSSVITVDSKVSPGMSGGGAFLYHKTSPTFFGIISAYHPFKQVSYIISSELIYDGLVSVKKSMNWIDQDYIVSRKKLGLPRVIRDSGMVFSTRTVISSTSGNDITDVGGNDITDVGGNDITDVGGNDITDVGKKQIARASEYSKLMADQHLLKRNVLEGIFLEKAGSDQRWEPFVNQQIVAVGDTQISDLFDFNKVVQNLPPNGSKLPPIITLKQVKKKQINHFKALMQNIDWIGTGIQRDLKGINDESTEIGLAVNSKKDGFLLTSWPIDKPCPTEDLPYISKGFKDQEKKTKSSFSNRFKINYGYESQSITLEEVSKNSRFKLDQAGLYQYQFTNDKDPDDWISLHFIDCKKDLGCGQLQVSRGFIDQGKHVLLYSYYNLKNQKDEIAMVYRKFSPKWTWEEKTSLEGQGNIHLSFKKGGISKGQSTLRSSKNGKKPIIIYSKNAKSCVAIGKVRSLSKDAIKIYIYSCNTDTLKNPWKSKIVHRLGEIIIYNKDEVRMIGVFPEDHHSGMELGTFKNWNTIKFVEAIPQNGLEQACLIGDMGEAPFETKNITYKLNLDIDRLKKEAYINVYNIQDYHLVMLISALELVSNFEDND